MLNLQYIKSKLYGNVDQIYRTVESLGFQNIKINNKYLSFPRLYGDNQSAIALYTDTLKVICFTNNDESGDLFSLVMNTLNVSFCDAINYVSKVCGIESDNIKYKVPFKGFFKKLLPDYLNNLEINMKTYDDSYLDEYRHKFNTMFFKDGISYETQEKYDIGYDLISNRITVPEYTFTGELCGIMGRSIDKDCPKEDRWLPIIPCSRSYTLFGYHRNYNMIQKKGLCVVGESEKFSMQLDSFGCYLGLGSCGCHLSETQVKYLKGLLISKIIVAYDEGLEEEYIREETKKLQINNPILANKVGYIFDREHDVIPEGSKGSPSDYGKEAFAYLVKNCTVWI